MSTVTPFVDSERLLTGNRRTVPWLEGRGIGGGVEGVVGRITAFKLGREWIENPVTVFARAGAGPFAASEAQGNIGAAILEKFKVILDYNHLRIILEPNARFREPLEYNRTGLSLVSFGPDYKRFQIDAVAEHSPAADAGVQSGDMLVAIDGRAAEEFTLSEVRLHFKDAKWCTLTIQRGDSRLQRRLELQRSI